MLEGLEISVLNLSEVKRNNEKLLRLEAEYFKKEYLNLEKTFSNSPSIKSVKANITCGPFGSNLLDTLYIEKGVLIVRPFNLKKLKVENDNLVFISEKNIKENGLKTFPKGSLLFSRVGDIKTGVLNREKATISPNIIVADFNNEKLAKYLAVFFETKYGFKQIQRQLKISAQPTVSTEIIGQLKFPKSSENFVNRISELVNLSFENEEKSTAFYTQAETLLLQEIGLKDFTPSQEAVNIKNFKESFGVTGRIDAEYYQPKYEQVVNKITSQNYDTLKNIVKISKSIEPGSAYYDEEGLPFMRVSDFSKEGLTQPQKFLNNYFVNENKDKIKDLKPKKGTILFSKDGSVGIAYHLREDFNGITSGAILHLKIRDEKRVIPEYLTLALNSKLVQMQAERDAGGSIILHWRVSEIENVVVPIIDYTKQEKIAELIEESFSLKKQSEHLLEVAKKAVEIAIEENEEMAMKFINDAI